MLRRFRTNREESELIAANQSRLRRASSDPFYSTTDISLFCGSWHHFNEIPDPWKCEPSERMAHSSRKEWDSGNTWVLDNPPSCRSRGKEKPLTASDHSSTIPPPTLIAILVGASPISRTFRLSKKLTRGEHISPAHSIPKALKQKTPDLGTTDRHQRGVGLVWDAKGV